MRLHGLGSVGWDWVNTGWTEKRLVEGLAMDARFGVSVWNRDVNLCKGRRQIWVSGWIRFV